MKLIKNTILVLSLLILDIITKIYFKGKSFFIFNYTENTGAVFGIFKDNNLFFIILNLIVILIIVYYYKEINIHYALNFILAGAIGNLISRIYYGFVIDFIDFRIWPIFNFADMFIVIGIMLIIYKN